MPSPASIDPELANMLRAELAAETARRDHHRSEARRHDGVAWSGVSPAPAPPRPLKDLKAQAEARLAARRAWRESDEGRLVAAISEYQAAARAAYTAGERARAALSRSADPRRRRDAIDEMATCAEILVANTAKALAF
jgi:hypothetical protein